MKLLRRFWCWFTGAHWLDFIPEQEYGVLYWRRCDACGVLVPTYKDTP